MERGTTRLTTREQEIVGLLGEGMSGSEIAAKLVVSPETVRTHIRNAMRKLGATTRSQAVLLALERGEIDRGDARPARADGIAPPSVAAGGRNLDLALERMTSRLAELPDVEAAGVLLADDDGLGLRRAAAVSSDRDRQIEIPERLALGEGPLGRVALNRRAALLPRLTDDPPSETAALAAPIVDAGRLHGVLALVVRPSRPARQSELLVLRALANRVAEILRSEENPARSLEATAQRFVLSWSAAGS